MRETGEGNSSLVPAYKRDHGWENQLGNGGLLVTARALPRNDRCAGPMTAGLTAGLLVTAHAAPQQHGDRTVACTTDVQPHVDACRAARTCVYMRLAQYMRR